MIMAKNKKSAGKLSEALKERTLSNDDKKELDELESDLGLVVKEEKFKKIDKQYFAICNDHIDEPVNDVITLSHMISKSNSDKVKIYDNNNSKNVVKATLQYRVLMNFNAGTKKGDVQGESKGNPQSLVQIALQSGRKHQIRAQFSHIKHPIIGDSKYLAKQQFKEKDIALHSSILSVKHPCTGKKMRFISRPPLLWSKRFGVNVIDQCNSIIDNLVIADSIKVID
jgi:23S rRNA-/tRNA-specific pseudouridylate synthase